MNKMIPRLILATLVAGSTVWGGTVGLWKDRKSYITDGMLATLREAGWKTMILEGKDISDGGKLADLDVVFLPGGHNAYGFPGSDESRNLIRFVASGKGILAGAMRSGYVRTSNRPLLPQVGATYNKVNGSYVWAKGDSPLAKAIDQPFCPGSWDHMVVKLGPLGKVFAVSDVDPVGVYGEVHGGRYVIFGAFIGIEAKTKLMQGTPRRALLAMLDWLADVPELTDAQKAKNQAQADLEFLRRQKLYDWTLNERGPDRGPGVIPQVRNRLAVSVESRQFTLDYMAQHLSGRMLKQCKSESAILSKAVEKLDRNFGREVTQFKSRIANMGLKELLPEDKAVVLAKVDAVQGKTDEEKKELVAYVKAAHPAGAAKRVAFYLQAGSISERLIPAAELRKLVDHAETVIVALRPAVRAAKTNKAKREQRRDRAAVRDLMKACDSDVVPMRREAVLELGRIGRLKTASTLIRMLKDPDEKIRILAILGLGWMQSKEAVPSLIELALSNDMPMRRRAVQALGQIGEPRAVMPLLGLLADRDHFTRENAILSLGWLKAKDAVPELLKIVTTFDRQDAQQRGLMISAIRALGHIGDPSVTVVLQQAGDDAKDFPVTKRRGRVTNIYSTPQSLGVQGHAQQAIAEIRAGGRKITGIKQAEFLASSDKFYGLTGRFNALAGRTSIVRSSNFKDDPAALWPYLWDAGMTGVHQAWGEPSCDPEEYMELIKAAGEFDLNWIDVLPLGRSRNYRSQRQHATADKNGVEAVLLKFENEPAFQGFWSEEIYPVMELTAEEFAAWLTNRHGASFHKKLGVKAGEDLLSLINTLGSLRTEYLLFQAERLVEHWREDQEWISGLRKGCAFTWSESDGRRVAYPGVTGKAGAAIDASGPENYQSFGRHNSFSMEMHKDGEARPVMCEFYNWYSPSPAHEIRGFAQHLMHGECFYNFSLNQVFGQASTYVMWTWNASRWGNLRKMFRKARKIREYLAVPESAANVALGLSEMSCVSFLEPGAGAWQMEDRWTQNQVALWTALNQSHVPTDIIWTETLTPEKLARYRILVLFDAKIITDGQAALLRKWVNNGGVLIANGTTSLFTQGTVPRKNYLLAGLFGLDYLSNVGVNDPERIDTYGIKRGQASVKAVSGLAPENFRPFVHRAVKPVKSLGLYKVTEKAAAFLPRIVPGTVCEYDMPLGYSKVKPASAQVLASFSNGDPALTLNRVSKGLCYFWTPNFPALSHTSSEWEMSPNGYDFWMNVRELLEAMVRGGLAHQGGKLPVEVTGISKEVEVTVRQQPEQNRWMIHLLDYDTKSNGVKGGALTVPTHAGKKVKRIFYPDTSTELKLTTVENAVTAQLRDFEVHDMVVIEWTR
ncbi:MAG: HEAT repeat domain-containing protein [Planctomycetota bacterium]|nr:HEAT repeat domain-containing protein [Planctomycetota bacterium]